jgi:hypothetical protein
MIAIGAASSADIETIVPSNGFRMKRATRSLYIIGGLFVSKEVWYATRIFNLCGGGIIVHEH